MPTATSTSNLIAVHRKKAGLSQQALADRIGSHWITVSKLERGKMRFSDEWRDKIATALGIDPLDLVPGARSLPTVHVEGMIEEGGEIVVLSEEDNTDSFTLSTDYFTSPAYRWLVVAGDALWPWFQDGDRICLWHLAEDEIESVLGRICVGWYEGKDGEEDVAIGVLGPGSTAGLYTLQRSGSPPLRDFKPTSLAVLAMAVYYLGPDSISEGS